MEPVPGLFEVAVGTEIALAGLKRERWRFRRRRRSLAPEQPPEETRVADGCSRADATAFGSSGNMICMTSGGSATSRSIVASLTAARLR